MKLFFWTTFIACSFSFGRVSSYHVVVVSPVESYIQKKQQQISQSDESGDSVKWKRRHKRRRKMNRRPQRGR
tara:strand:- start:3737 stop:3952 length:216 start_codon:yes stop_codon:yes gene_type:complete